MWIYCRPLTKGQRGEVYEVNLDRVAVILDINEDRVNEGEVENHNDDSTKPPIYWIHGNFLLKLAPNRESSIHISLCSRT